MPGLTAAWGVCNMHTPAWSRSRKPGSTAATRLRRMTHVVETSNLTKRYGARAVVAGLDLRIPQGARAPGLPKVLAQPDIGDHPYPPRIEQRPGGGPTWVHDVMAEALGHAADGDWTAVEGELCRTCPHRGGCPVWTPEDPR